MAELNINWFPGHMAKAIRQMKEKLALVDLVIEIRDSRAVNSSINPVIQELFKNKLRIILLNKKDLSDSKINQKWITHLESNHLVKVLATNLLVEQPKPKIIKLIDDLMRAKITQQKKRQIINYQIRVMVIGIPNVGKSKLINILTQRKATKVANAPGVTRSLQWVKLTKTIYLLDTPGILWPKLDHVNVAKHLSLIGAIQEKLLPIPDLAYYAFNFLAKHYPEHLKTKYNITINSELPLSLTAMDSYFLKMQSHSHPATARDQQIVLMMEKFYQDLKNGIVKNISWEWPSGEIMP